MDVNNAVFKNEENGFANVFVGKGNHLTWSSLKVTHFVLVSNQNKNKNK